MTSWSCSVVNDQCSCQRSVATDQPIAAGPRREAGFKMTKNSLPIGEGTSGKNDVADPHPSTEENYDKIRRLGRSNPHQNKRSWPEQLHARPYSTPTKPSLPLQLAHKQTTPDNFKLGSSLKAIGRLRPGHLRMIHVGAWSLVFSQPRTWRSTPASIRRLATDGASNRWSIRRPASRPKAFRK